MFICADLLIVFYTTNCNGDIPRVKTIIYDIHTQEYSQELSKYPPTVKAVFKTCPNLVKQLKSSKFYPDLVFTYCEPEGSIIQEVFPDAEFLLSKSA